MDTDKTEEYIAELAKKYPIKSRFSTLLDEIQSILAEMGIIDLVEVNPDLLGKAVIDYFEDVDRLKDFEGIPHINVDKIYSYGVYWILRRSPIQILDKKLDKRFMHINEKICTALIFPKMLAEMGIPQNSANDRYAGFLDLIYYNFRYRTYTQQSLELMIEAFFCGYAIKKGDSDGQEFKDDSRTDK